MELQPVRPGNSLDVVVTSMASDSHSWNLVFLQLLLSELGHRVTNLGPCVPDEVLIGHCLAARPDLVVVSTVNGHGFPDGMRLIRELRADLPDLPVVIGGKIGIRAVGNAELAEHLLAAGFDAVFEDSGGLRSFTSFVQKLIPARVA
jgi:methylaspartate mutase sigma subunit